MAPTIFDRENAPSAQAWLNSVRSFYEPRRTLQNHASNHTEQDGAAEAGVRLKFHDSGVVQP